MKPFGWDALGRMELRCLERATRLESDEGRSGDVFRLSQFVLIGGTFPPPHDESMRVMVRRVLASTMG